MSADNWAVCPMCYAGATTKRDEARRVAAEAYGKVPVEEFDRLRAEGDCEIDTEDLRTFREDWDIGVYDCEANRPSSHMLVSYEAQCSVCGLKVDFKHEQRVWPPAEERG